MNNIFMLNTWEGKKKHSNLNTNLWHFFVGMYVFRNSCRGRPVLNIANTTGPRGLSNIQWSSGAGWKSPWVWDTFPLSQHYVSSCIKIPSISLLQIWESHVGLSDPWRGVLMQHVLLLSILPLSPALYLFLPYSKRLSPKHFHPLPTPLPTSSGVT